MVVQALRPSVLWARAWRCALNPRHVWCCRCRALGLEQGRTPLNAKTWAYALYPYSLILTRASARFAGAAVAAVRSGRALRGARSSLNARKLLRGQILNPKY